MVNPAKKREMTWGFGIGSVWHTAVGLTDFLKFVNVPTKLTKPKEENDDIDGALDGHGSESLPEKVSEAYEGYAVYEGMVKLLYMLMGKHTCALEGAYLSTYEHIFEIQDPWGLFLTLARDYAPENKVHEIPSAKVIKMTISGDKSKAKIDASFEFLGDTIVNNSATNTHPISVTFPDPYLYLLWKDLDFEINSSDICIDRFNLEIWWEVDDTNMCDGEESMAEPVCYKISSKLTIGFPQVVTDDWFENFKNQTDQVDVALKFTSDTLVAPAEGYYRFFLEFPLMEVDDYAEGKDDIIKPEVVLTSKWSASAGDSIVITTYDADSYGAP